MAADQLLSDGVERIVDAEGSFLGGHLGEEDGLQHQVAKFFGETRPVAPVDGVEHLVGLFEQIRLDGVEVLFAIPRTAAGRAQPGHDSDQALKPFASCSLDPVAFRRRWKPQFSKGGKGRTSIWRPGGFT